MINTEIELDEHINKIKNNAKHIGPEAWQELVLEMIESTDNMKAKDIINSFCVKIMYIIIKEEKNAGH